MPHLPAPFDPQHGPRRHRIYRRATNSCHDEGVIEVSFQLLREVFTWRDDEIRLTCDWWPIPTRPSTPPRFFAKTPPAFTITQIALQAPAFYEGNGPSFNAFVVVVECTG